MSERMMQDRSEGVGTETFPQDSSTRDAAYEASELHTTDLVARSGDSHGGDGDGMRRPPRPSEDLEDKASPLLGDTENFRRRWEAVQTGFVDEPRRAVENADALVAEIIQELAESFARERNGLESQWSEGDQVSTEDLRVSLRRYRSFFDRLLLT